MGYSQKKFLALLLVAVLLSGALVGCGLIQAPDDVSFVDGDPATTPEPTAIDTRIPCDGRISIAFVPGDALNPYTSTSRDNLSVGGLLYEGLYALGENFTAIPTLAEGITTLDGRRYTLEIQSGVTFHNGARLTVDDVIYSLDRAQNSARFGGRLEIVSGYERRYDAAGERLDYEMDIILSRVHGNIPVLLTFPIIPRGSFGWTVPPGTGPYRFTEEDGLPRLVRFPAHPHSDSVPMETIYLTEVVTQEQMTAHFNAGILDILALELTATGEPQLAATRELRHFETSLMDYVGFNIQRPEMRRAEVRQAISYAIDRAYIAENIMRGAAVASALPIHPALFYYDTLLAAEFSFDLSFARQLLEGEVTLGRPQTQERGDSDTDDEEHDAESPLLQDAEEGDEDDDDPDDETEDDEDEDEDESPRAQLTLLVAGGNTNRMDVAVYIAASIAELGYQVIIDDRPYNEFLEALEDGDFDLFYGQVRLQPDFDLTELLFGNLVFGGADNQIDSRLLDDFMASGQSDRGFRAAALCRALMEETPFTVLGFRHLTVATQRGVVIGMQPTQENVYHNVWEWIVNL